MQVDFAENYTCLWQDEVQSAHWNKRQVTIFSSVLWSASGAKSNAIISDDLSHTKHSIVCFLDHLLSLLSDDTAEHVTILSDGPSCQFKNKFIAHSLKFLQDRHKVVIHWIFSASHHGKGAIDGV